MFVFFRLTFICALLLPFSGCFSEYRKQLLVENVPQYTPDPDDGFLIGSFTYEVRDAETGDTLIEYGEKIFKVVNYYGFRFRRTDNRNLGGNVVARKKSGLFEPTRMRDDFSIPGGKGQYFVVPAPAGKYKFYEWYAYIGAGSAGYPELFDKPYSVPFEIVSGQALYIGEIRAVTFCTRGLFNLQYPSYVMLEFHDQYERDMQQITERYPFIADCSIKQMDLKLEFRQACLKEK